MISHEEIEAVYVIHRGGRYRAALRMALLHIEHALPKDVDWFLTEDRGWVFSTWRLTISGPKPSVDAVVRRVDRELSLLGMS